MSTPLALGVDLGGSKIEAALLAPGGGARWRERVPTPAGDYAATLREVAALVRRATALCCVPPTVGIGHPGSATPDGLIRNANSTCLNGRPLQRDLEAMLGQPLRLANDANCLALSEATDGAAAGAAVVFGVILGTGVGGGIAVNGRVWPGANGIAGEWGHNPLPWAVAGDDPAPACYCGCRGCIETLLSGPALAADHQRAGGEAMSAEHIAAAATADDGAAIATLERHADRLARALAAVVNLLDPDVIVVGGGLSRLPGLRERIVERWSRWIFSAGADAPLRTRLAVAAHGDASGVRGAAWLWREPKPGAGRERA
jgi:fructokinase